MSDSPVNLSSGIPETELPPESEDLLDRTKQANALSADDRREALSKLVKEKPTFLGGWAHLSEAARDDIEGYAYARVGYHRGLDALRKAGWRGTGYVRWRVPGNQGFLLCLERLRQRAEAIGEKDEAERCALFLRQLDPDWRDLQ